MGYVFVGVWCFIAGFAVSSWMVTHPPKKWRGNNSNDNS
jgi:hypothetical protein